MPEAKQMESNNNTKYRISQERFLKDPSTAGTDKTLWEVPTLRVTTTQYWMPCPANLGSACATSLLLVPPHASYVAKIS